MKKRWIASVLVAALLLSVAAPGKAAEPESAPADPASEPEFCCGTDPAVAQQAHELLLQNKMMEWRQVSGAAESDVELLQGNEKLGSLSMPSTGNVKMLVIPVAYPDQQEYRDSFDSELWNSLFFDPYTPEKRLFYQSVRGYYQWTSYGRLDITGTIMPIYDAPHERDYYYDGHYTHSLPLQELLLSILGTYSKAGIDLSEYDNDGDGILDSVVLFSLAPSNYSWMESVSAFAPPIEEGSLRAGLYALFTFGAHPDPTHGFYGDVSTLTHEIGHLLGLPDNYAHDDATINVLDSKLNDLMGQCILDTYINAYYKILFGWIDPLILTDTSDPRQVTLFPVEPMENPTEAPRAVVLIPDDALFPFTEFFLAEYRNGSYGGDDDKSIFYKNPGVVIWHVNAARKASSYIFKENYLKPVYRGTPIYEEEDIYTEGAEFSSKSPGSYFYGDDYYGPVHTGAYLKVESLSPDKAVLQTGFRDPTREPAPVIEISSPTRKAVRKDGPPASMTITVKSGDKLPDRSEMRYTQRDGFFLTTGTVTYYGLKDNLTGENPQEVILFDALDWHSSSLEGEGTIQFAIPAGAVRYNGKDSNAVVSEIVYVDNTPPTIELLGDEPQRILKGVKYIEQGAKVSDNLDPEIEDKLQIDASQVDTQTPGTYTVTYTVTDHAEHTASLTRTVIVEESEIDGHMLTKTERKEPGCTEPGNEEYWTCRVCGNMFADEDAAIQIEEIPTIPAKGHISGTSWISDASNHWHACDCGEMKTDLAAHNPVTDPAVPASCTTPGKTEGSHCGVCGYTITPQKEVETISHKLTKTERKEPGCIEPGNEAYWTCSVCKGLFSDENGTAQIEYIPFIPNKGHIYGTSWVSDTTSHWHECVCGERAYSVAHSPITDPAVPADCTTPGKTEGSYCSVCGYIITPQEEVEASGHSFTKTERKEPSCTEAGNEEYWTCGVCGKMFADEDGTAQIEKIPTIPATEHSYGTSWVSDAANHWHACDCGEMTADLAAHSPVTDPAVPADCTTPGKTEGSHCGVCGYIITPQEEVEASGHRLTKTERKEPDCTQAGNTEYWTCGVCGKMFSDEDGTAQIEDIPVIPAKGHSYAEQWSSDETAHWHECSNCGDTKDVGSHAEDGGVVTVRPTVEAEGVKTYTCTVCGRITRTETLPKLEPEHVHSYDETWKFDTVDHWRECSCGEKAEQAAHTFGAWTTTKAATATAKGSKERSCTICGCKQTEDIPATGGSGGGGSGSGGDGGGFISEPKYTVSLPEKIDGGDVKAEPQKAEKGKTVTVTVIPETDYDLDKLTVREKTGKEVSLKEEKDGKYSFVMPGADVEVTAMFKRREPPAETGPRFTDVADHAWYYSAVEYVTGKGLFNGTSQTTFSPNGNMTRGMLVTVLHRMEKEPEASAAVSFPDVLPGCYYTQAVAWAAENGVVKGYGNGNFGPNDPITREQLAVILYRYAGNPTPPDLQLNFDDRGQIKYYAQDALRWAVDQGIITGKDGGLLDPQGQATRAEVATMLMRYCENWR